MNYTALSNRVIGKTIKKGERTLASGIVVPEDVNKSPYMYVEVIDVGRGHISYSGEIVKMETKVGDIIMLINSTPFVLPKDNDYGKIENLKDSEDLVIFQESDIMCRINK